MEDPIKLREYDSLDYKNPFKYVAYMRWVQQLVTASTLPENVRNLRTHSLKTQKEQWHAGIFAIGLS